MLTFLIPLKSKNIAKSWTETSTILETTLKSISSQTSSQYEIIIVGNDPPDLEYDFLKVTFLSVDFPLPLDSPDPDKNFRLKDRDRDLKVTYGLLYIYQKVAHQQDEINYVMVVDADDLVSCNLATFVELHNTQNSSEIGWFFNCGYRYRTGSLWIRFMRKGFDRYCGTSILIQLSGYRFLAEVLNPELLMQILQAGKLNLELEKIADLYQAEYRHRDIRETFQKRGQPLKPLPFPGAVYVQHNDNMLLGNKFQKSRAKLTLINYFWKFKSFFDYRYFSERLRREFGIE